MIRSFVAIDLPEGAKDALRGVVSRLRPKMPPDSVRWTRVSGIHLTLKFLGDVAEADLTDIKQVLADVAGKHSPFTVGIGGVGCFPNVKRPRVVWVGVHTEGDQLAALQRDVEHSLAPLGFDVEKRAYHPHLTLGRTQRRTGSRDQARIGEVVATAGIGELGQVRVKAINLMRSDLRPSGAVYTPLAVLPLGLKQDTE
jgi:2'-5' RNA ligase